MIQRTACILLASIRLHIYIHFQTLYTGIAINPFERVNVRVLSLPAMCASIIEHNYFIHLLHNHWWPNVSTPQQWCISIWSRISEISNSSIDSINRDGSAIGMLQQLLISYGKSGSSELPLHDSNPRGYLICSTFQWTKAMQSYQCAESWVGIAVAVNKAGHNR